MYDDSVVELQYAAVPSTGLRRVLSKDSFCIACLHVAAYSRHVNSSKQRDLFSCSRLFNHLA